MKIYCSYPRAQYLAHQADIDKAIKRVLDSDRYILGEEVSAFECEFAEWLGIKHCVGVNSGTDALFLALRGLGVGLGDEVIAPSYTAVPTISSIGMTGAKPVLVDVNPLHYTIDPEKVEEAITPHTSAIIAVHLFGQPADLEHLKSIALDHNLKLIEDCAQAHGGKFNDARLGTIGDVGCFSFFPTKNLGALGDGGAIVTRDDKLAERIIKIRQYGWDDKRVSQEQGWNSRLDEIQAAVLRAKLPYLENDTERRIALAARYDAGLASLPFKLPSRRKNSRHVFHLYVLQLEERDALISHLSEHGIYAGTHYPVVAHQMPAYSGLEYGGEGLPVSDSLTEHVVSLPMYPELTDLEQGQIISTIREFYSK